MKISVIIPTYKPGGYIWDCLKSLNYQTFSPFNFEIIIVLNGYQEPYFSQIENYITHKIKCDNMFLFYTEIAGVSNARNIGLDNARGEFISFIDDDDMVSPTYLEELFKVVDKNTIALSNTIAFKDGDLNMEPLPYKLNSIFKKLDGKGNAHFNKARAYFSGPCMKLISQSIINQRRFDVAFKNGEDSLFMFLISDKIKYVITTEQNAIYFRRNRYNSAFNSKKALNYKFQNSFSLILAYSKIYFNNYKKYNFTFYITRVLGAIKSLFN